MSSGRWHIWTALGLAVLSLAWPIGLRAQETQPAVDSAAVADSFDQDMYRDYQSNAWTTLDDLGRDFESDVTFWMPIAPPGTNLAEWVQTGTRPLVLIDPAQLPTDFVENLTPSFDGGVTVHPIYVVEDISTRYRIVYNADGQAVATLPPPSGYDALCYFRRIYPEFDQWGWSDAELAEAAAPFDTARLTVRYDLITDDDLITFLLRRAVDEVAVEQADSMGLSIARSAALGGEIFMDSMQSSGTLSNIVIETVTYATNGITMSISFPDDMTSGIDVFSCTNLDAFQATTWKWAATNVSTAGGSPIQWTGAITTNGFSWFYAVGDNGLDSDADGLSDAQEMYLRHTDPRNADTDGDGMPDGWEVGYGLNPLSNGDASSDPDGDGISNLIEYLQGRNPTKGATVDTNGQVGLHVYTRLE